MQFLKVKMKERSLWTVFSGSQQKLCVAQRFIISATRTNQTISSKGLVVIVPSIVELLPIAFMEIFVGSINSLGLTPN